jgi:hypothetical protein
MLPAGKDVEKVTGALPFQGWVILSLENFCRDIK